jgi:hypothetical protein
MTHPAKLTLAAPFPNFSTTSKVLSSSSSTSAASAIATKADSDSLPDANSGRDNRLDDVNDDEVDAALTVDDGAKARHVSPVEAATASASVQVDNFIIVVVFVFAPILCRPLCEYRANRMRRGGGIEMKE